MKINKIKLVGFKGYEKETIYNFDKLYTLIVGPNGAGKTSIPEGICWCLYGCNLNGNDKADSLLLNKKSEEMCVEVEVEIDGEISTITRVKKKTISIKINGEKITQKALEEILPKKELFLSIFNPRYFVGLTPSKARARLISMLPEIDPLQVLEKFNAWEHMPVVTKYKNDINSSIKKLTKDIKDLNEKLSVRAGEKNTYIQLVSDVETRLKDSGDTISISDEEINLINELEEKISIERSKQFVGVSASELQLKVEIVTNKYRELSQIRYNGESNTLINEMELELASMRGQYKVLVQNLEEMKSLGSQCNCCGQSIPEEFKLYQIEMVNKKIEQLKSQANGYKASIEIIKNAEKEKEDEFNRAKEEQMNCGVSEVKALQDKLRALNETNAKAQEEFKKAQELALNDYVIKLDGLTAKRQASISLTSELNINKANLLKYKDMLSKVDESVENLEASLTEASSEKESLTKYNSHYVNFIGEILQTYLVGTKIHLYKVSENGELKEDFFITYDGKEHSLLSNSERIRVGLDIANMFNELLSIEYPTFVDDSESIIQLPTINSQMIICKVEDCDIINIK